MKEYTISIIGSGNVGRRIGEYFSKYYKVIFYDIDDKVIKLLKKNGYHGTLDINYAINNSDISFIAVPTPLDESSGLYDTSYLANVSLDISNILSNSNYKIFVIKSTVIPGTTENVIIPNLEYKGKVCGIDFDVIYCPEFLTVINTTWTNDEKFCVNVGNESRIVLGESNNQNNNKNKDINNNINKNNNNNKNAGDVIQSIYEKVNPDAPIIRTDYKTAEFCKLAVNNRLALAVSFSNEIYLACEELKKYDIDIDADLVMKSIAMDPRIGEYGSIYGKAFGGPCFLKDTVALRTYIEDYAHMIPLLIKDSIVINKDMIKKYGIRE